MSGVDEPSPRTATHGVHPAETPEDVVAAQRQAVKAFDNYFALAPEADVKAARAIVGPAGPGTRN